MARNTSLKSLPPEILRLIGLYFEFQDLVSFQESSLIVFTATTEVSFYNHYFTENYRDKAISEVCRNRFFIQNWTGVVKRLYGNMFEYSRYFVDYARQNSHEKEISGPVITGCELEHLGYKLGKIFAQIFEKLCHCHGQATFRDAFTSASNTTAFSSSDVSE